MSWLLFLDESGHDHKNMPYEVRGGIALQDSQLWPFVQAMARLELDSFGCQLHQHQAELKGCSLLDRKRFKFAAQGAPLAPEARRKHCRAFLTKGREKKKPTRDEFTAVRTSLLRNGSRDYAVVAEPPSLNLCGGHSPQRAKTKQCKC
jgi:hypothetical protein